MKHVGSMHTGQIDGTATQQSLPVVGNNAGRVGAVASRADTHPVAAWLARQTPEAVEALAVSRASSHGVALKVNKGFHSTRDAAGNVTGHHVTIRSVDVSGPADAMPLVLADLENMKTPAPKPEIETWLAELSVIVRRKPDDEFTENLRIAAYASRLAEFPADVARHALLKHTWEFWPSWAELQKVCAALVAPRDAMISAVLRFKPKEEAPRELPSRERRAEMVAEASRVIAELAGKSQHA